MVVVVILNKVFGKVVKRKLFVSVVMVVLGRLKVIIII